MFGQNYFRRVDHNFFSQFHPQCSPLQFVMHDYGTRLFDGVTKCRSVQSSAMQFLLTHRFVSYLFTFNLVICLLIVCLLLPL